MLAGEPMLARRSMIYAGAGPLDQPAHGQPQQRSDLPPPLLGRHHGLGMLDGQGRPPGMAWLRPHREGRSPFT